MSEPVTDRVAQILASHPADAESLIHVLQDINKQLGYLPLEALQQVAAALSLPLSRVASVSTFYKAFSLEPRGKTVLRVCQGTACYVRGSREVAEEIGNQLGVANGKTTADGLFTLETVNCVGACALGPVVMAGERVHGHVEPGIVAALLEEARHPRETAAARPSDAPRQELPRLDSLEEASSWLGRVRAEYARPRREILVCAGTGCLAAGAEKLAFALEREVAAQGGGAPVRLVLKQTGCHGFCEMGPLVVLFPDDTLYVKVAEKDAREIVQKLLGQEGPVQRLLCPDPVLKTRALRWIELPFYAGQQRVTLRNIGRIDPSSLLDYAGSGGYRALVSTLASTTPDGVIEKVLLSGLRGRGGAGFPTGVKWARCRAASGDRKVLVCNGDEGDPGAYMDRSLFEGDPHAILEGMIIGAFAIGASEGHCYVRHEYPLALERMEKAIRAAREAGFLGENILGTGLDFDVKITRGGGAFVCGEETALLASIEGKAGRPTPRPPYPVDRGLRGLPTVINNVETLATVPLILLRGAEWYSSMGTEGSKGTKVFSLVGKVRNTGLVEVPMGLSLRDLVMRIGGGVPRGRRLKAVQVGGPSGGCLPESELDRPVDYEALAQAGTIMGSGGIIVMDDRTCMVDVARYFTAFLEEESCGNCAPCRDGLHELRQLLDRVCNGQAVEADVGRIEKLAHGIRLGSLCGLGKTAANPVLSTLRYFREEYREHIEERRCSAGVCRELARFQVNEKCNGCALCVPACPIGAITGERRKAHVIDQNRCVHCGLCAGVCNRAAIDILNARELAERTRQVQP